MIGQWAAWCCDDVVMEQMMTEESSGIQPKGDIISVEHSYALPGIAFM